MDIAAPSPTPADLFQSPVHQATPRPDETFSNYAAARAKFLQQTPMVTANASAAPAASDKENAAPVLQGPKADTFYAAQRKFRDLEKKGSGDTKVKKTWQTVQPPQLLRR